MTNVLGVSIKKPVQDSSYSVVDGTQTNDQDEPTNSNKDFYRRNKFILTFGGLLFTSAALLSFAVLVSSPLAVTTPSLFNYDSSGGGNLVGISNSNSNYNKNSFSDSQQPLLAPRRNKAINYYLQTQAFLNTLTSCIQNPECNIYFQHVPKTGGTTIEKRLYPKLWEQSCCTQKIMKNFYQNTSHYCRKKFISLQVDGKQFKRVVQKCRNIDSRVNKPIVVLTTTREPIGRLLSGIHEICNKNLWTRSDNAKKACRTCNYDRDEEFWLKFTIISNEMYHDQYNFVLRSLALLENVKVLYVDTRDISDLFDRLLQLMPELEGDVILGDENTFNPEALKTCNFGLKSAMIKALSPSLDIYRNYTLGT